MIPIIMNTNFERLGLVDDYSSFIWTERYYTPGEFQLTMPINEKNLALMKKDYYVCRDDAEEMGIIENIKLTKTIYDKLVMIVSGRFLSSIIGRRIIGKTVAFTNMTIPNIIRNILYNNIYGLPVSKTNRYIPNFGFQDDSNFQVHLSRQYTGKNILDVVEELCKHYGLGFKTILENGKFVFHLYKGIDRSYGQQTNTFVVFSPDYDNLESADYEEDYTKLITDVFVAGEGEGQARKAAWTDTNSQSGLARYELFKDARNTRSDDGQIADDVYIQQLKDEGNDEITAITKAFAGKVYFNNYVYKKDINIGDVCTIKNPDWGISINARLVEMIESVNENGVYSMTPSFGE